ncbi:MAG: DUF302 domain-containing protein [archaeon]
MNNSGVDIMYGYKKEIKDSYEKAITHLEEELKKEGFGILTEINVKTTLKKKLDVDIEKYVILGACNPPYAYKSLQAEQDIGLLLPCNIIVYEKEGKTFVSAIKPTIAMQISGNEKLKVIAEEIEQKLKKVIDSL